MGKKKAQVDHTMLAGGDSSDSNEENQPKLPATNCPHANKAIHLVGVKKVLRNDGLPQECVECNKINNNNSKKVEDNEEFSLMICLKCGFSGCGNGCKHAEQHSKNRQSDVHDLALSSLTWTVWCFKCNIEIPSNSSRKLLDCVEFIKKHSVPNNVDEEQDDKDKEKDNEAKSSVTFTVSPPRKSSTFMHAEPILSSPSFNSVDSLPRVRGLSNLGNTCFFNALLQCLGQTPFLFSILEEMKESGEKFKLPGGEVQIGEEKENLEPLEGVLREWGQLTRVLADTLSEIQSGKTEVYSPRRLLSLLHMKCPQFAGYDQHDSHELLRQLLELVRTEDLQRYQAAILEQLNLDKKCERENITEEMKRKVKAYGRQANDMLLRPEQVFRGFLVSTLECQECQHTSDSLESFLDLSLPVMADKPFHIRRKSSSEAEGGDLSPSQPSKYQLRKAAKAAAKAARRNKKNSKWTNDNQPTNAAGDGAIKEEKGKDSTDSEDQDQSDADVEDNAEGEAEANQNQDIIESGYSSEKPVNGDSACGSPASETNLPINRDSAIASPITNDNLIINKPTDQVLDLAIPDNSLSKDNVLISSPGSQLSMACQPSPLTSSSDTNLECRLSPADEGTMNLERPTSRFEYNPEPMEGSPDYQDQSTYVNTNGNTQYDDNNRLNSGNVNLVNSDNDKMTRLDSEFRKLDLDNPKKEKERGLLGLYDENEEEEDDDDDDGYLKRDSWSVTMAQRNHVEPSGECTLLSCLNQFTAKELMTGNNKWGCEACTKRANQGKPGKTVLTNASKQLLISSPPAILILHLKRFQVFRCTFRKKSREVKFPTMFDLAPYCSMKCKNSPTVNKDQTELLYSLYGVVEHMGTLHGGHYVAYVKVRSPLKPNDPRWSFLPKQGCEALSSEESNNENHRTSNNGAVGGTPEPPPGKWYYVSDSRVSEVKEEAVLRSQAYLLFYERIW